MSPALFKLLFDCVPVSVPRKPLQHWERTTLEILMVFRHFDDSWGHMQRHIVTRLTHHGSTVLRGRAANDTATFSPPTRGRVTV